MHYEDLVYLQMPFWGLYECIYTFFTDLLNFFKKIVQSLFFRTIVIQENVKIVKFTNCKILIAPEYIIRENLLRAQENKKFHKKKKDVPKKLNSIFEDEDESN